MLRSTIQTSSAARVESALTELLEAKVRSAAPYGPLFMQLWTLAADRIAGGKLVRPVLFLELARSLSTDDDGTRDDDLTRVAVALELLHFSFLLHDDVIDGDLVRRGEPNLVGALAALAPAAGSVRDGGALHWARSCAVLMGDLLLAEVHQIIARLGVPHDQRVQLLDLLAHTVVDSVAGEQKDVALSHGILAPELETILEMCHQKTSTYTFELPLRAATVLAGMPHAETTLTEAGRHLGLAFQLQDDLLSVFGDAEAHGKDAYSDLREGKETAIVAYARMTSAWPSIAPSFGSRELGEPEGARVRDLLTGCGAEAFVRGLIDEQVRAFHDALARGADAVPAAARGVLMRLAARLEERRA